MPLCIDGKRVSSIPVTVDEFFKQFPKFKNSAEVLKCKPVTIVPSLELLYVDQCESAVVSPKDAERNITVVGSEDATTCHIIVIRHTGCGATCLSHIDDTGYKSEIFTMVKRVMELAYGVDGRLQLHMVGGFMDAKGTSKGITLALLNIFHDLPQEIDLITACITNLNDEIKQGDHWPVIYGIACNIQSGEIFPAAFPDKGPDMPLRGARRFTGKPEVICIYDNSDGLISLGPFNYKPWPDAKFYLKQSDSYLRQNLSTSPKQESAQFASQVRQAIQQLVDNPNPMETVFHNKKPRLHRKQGDGCWIKLS